VQNGLGFEVRDSFEWDFRLKVSRGEENIFVWRLFMAICERVMDGHPSNAWVKYLYIDDPISPSITTTRRDPAMKLLDRRTDGRGWWSPTLPRKNCERTGHHFLKE
jgi:hypothetical protein